MGAEYNKQDGWNNFRQNTQDRSWKIYLLHWIFNRKQENGGVINKIRRFIYEHIPIQLFIYEQWRLLTAPNLQTAQYTVKCMLDFLAKKSRRAHTQHPKWRNIWRIFYGSKLYGMRLLHNP